MPLDMTRLPKALPILAALLGLSAALSGCGPSDVIEFKINRMVEADHWSRGGNKTCQIHYQILNNTAQTLNALTADFVWRDAYGEDFGNPVMLQSPLPADKATRVARTALMYGSCDGGVELVGIRNVTQCDLDGVGSAECEAKLLVTRVD